MSKKGGVGVFDAPTPAETDEGTGDPKGVPWGPGVVKVAATGLGVGLG